MRRTSGRNCVLLKKVLILRLFISGAGLEAHAPQLADPDFRVVPYLSGRL